MNITWFRHSHENRNDLLRFGFMRLHYQRRIRYTERPFSDIARFGFSKAIAEQKDPRHVSFLLVKNGSQTIRCLVDSEDSFALITPLIAEVDVCFCAGYNADFFERKRFVQAYSWQTEADLAWYRQMLGEKIERLGNQFQKIRRFVPIAPNQGTAVPQKAFATRYKNLLHRLNRMLDRGTDFGGVYQTFELRQAYLAELRNEDLRYDVVLNDSLWGWPAHRINLHRQLANLNSKGFNIHSILNWQGPSDHVGGDDLSLRQADFPMVTNPINGSYERMLAQSRLAIFACGFHWGWRNIMMLALQAGVPVLTDRLLTEPYFDITEFKLLQQEDHQWSGVEKALKEIDADTWRRWKQHNQTVYDKYMSPEAVAGYVISSLKSVPHVPHQPAAAKSNSS